jgi:hypothetical protein
MYKVEPNFKLYNVDFTKSEGLSEVYKILHYQ